MFIGGKTTRTFIRHESKDPDTRKSHGGKFACTGGEISLGRQLQPGPKHWAIQQHRHGNHLFAGVSNPREGDNKPAE